MIMGCDPGLSGALFFLDPLVEHPNITKPIVEEIMFRGVLYHLLRESTRNWRVWSIVFSVAASGFVFAVIHPQGWLGVPVLMGVSAGDRASSWPVAASRQTTFW